MVPGTTYEYSVQACQPEAYSSTTVAGNIIIVRSLKLNFKIYDIPGRVAQVCTRTSTRNMYEYTRTANNRRKQQCRPSTLYAYYSSEASF